MIVVPNHRKNIDDYKNPSLTHLIANFDYKENHGKKSFSCKSEASNHVYQCRKHDCSANNKKNGDYYDFPSLSDFMNGH